MARTVVALFDNTPDAQAAINDLVNAGYPRDNMSIVANQPSGTYQQGTAPTEVTGTEAAEGAGIGAATGGVAGGIAGLLASLGLLAIPGIGPFLAAGPIVAILTGGALGAAAGGLIGGLIGLGIPEDEAEMYAEGVRRGGTLVSLQTDEASADRAAEIMSAHNAIDIDERATEWQRSGWSRSTGHQATPPASSGPATNPRDRAIDAPRSDIDGQGTRDESIYQNRNRSTGVRIYNP